MDVVSGLDKLDQPLRSSSRADEGNLSLRRGGAKWTSGVGGFGGLLAVSISYPLILSQPQASNFVHVVDGRRLAFTGSRRLPLTVPGPHKSTSLGLFMSNGGEQGE